MNLIRILDFKVKNQWDQIKGSKHLEELDEDCPPRFLEGWTDDNPSLWETDNPPVLDVNTILYAIYRSKNYSDKIAYLRFDKSAIDEAQLALIQTKGRTNDPLVDGYNIHYEIQGMTGKGLCMLIYHILNSQFETGEYKKADFQESTNEYCKAFRTKMLDEAQSLDNETQSVYAEFPSSSGTKKGDKNGQEEISTIYKQVSSGSVDPSTNETSSTTAL